MKAARLWFVHFAGPMVMTFHHRDADVQPEIASVIMHQARTHCKDRKSMDLACTSRSFTREPLLAMLRKISDLEFSKVELQIADASPHLTSAEVLESTQRVVQRLRQGPTSSYAALSLNTKATGPELVQLVAASASLAKALACVHLVIEPEINATLDQEVARLKELENVVSIHSVILCVNTKLGSIYDDYKTAIEVCDRVPGVYLCLDPTTYLIGPFQNHPPDEIYPFVRHTRLRDSGKTPDQFQVRIGRGEFDYTQIIQALEQVEYQGALTVDIMEELAEPGFDVEAEVRTLRLLLETLT